MKSFLEYITEQSPESKKNYMYAGEAGDTITLDDDPDTVNVVGMPLFKQNPDGTWSNNKSSLKDEKIEATPAFSTVMKLLQQAGRTPHPSMGKPSDTNVNEFRPIYDFYGIMDKGQFKKDIETENIDRIPYDPEKFGMPPDTSIFDAEEKLKNAAKQLGYDLSATRNPESTDEKNNKFEIQMTPAKWGEITRRQILHNRGITDKDIQKTRERRAAHPEIGEKYALPSLDNKDLDTPIPFMFKDFGKWKVQTVGATHPKGFRDEKKEERITKEQKMEEVLEKIRKIKGVEVKSNTRKSEDEIDQSLRDEYPVMINTSDRINPVTANQWNSFGPEREVIQGVAPSPGQLLQNYADLDGKLGKRIFDTVGHESTHFWSPNKPSPVEYSGKFSNDRKDYTLHVNELPSRAFEIKSGIKNITGQLIGPDTSDETIKTHLKTIRDKEYLDNDPEVLDALETPEGMELLRQVRNNQQKQDPTKVKPVTNTSIPQAVAENTINTGMKSFLRYLEEKSAAWTRSEGKDPKGGLNKKGVASYRRENPGSKLQTAVTTKPSKLKPGSKKAKRRKSFCSRMCGMKRRLTSQKTASNPDSRINKALRKWNCKCG